MAFPASPVHGQSAVVNNITYTYNSTNTAWTRVLTSVTGTNTFNVASTAQSTSTTTGALTVAGGVGIQGNIYFGGSLYQNGLLFTGGGGGGASTSTVLPPANPNVGDIWYRTTTDQIFRYTFDGVGSYWVDITGPEAATVGTAINIPAGGPGQLVYQSAPNTTNFVTTGSSGQVLVSAGTGSPYWTTSTNLLGGSSSGGSGTGTTSTFIISINSSTTSTTTGGLQVSGGIGVAGDIYMGGTGFFKFPIGTTAQRPANPQAGMARINSDNGSIEVFYASTWTGIAVMPYQVTVLAWGGGGGGGGPGGWSYGAPGGAGGFAQATVNVYSGATYYAVVGGYGGAVGTPTSSIVKGGGGGMANCTDNRYGGQGGGYSGLHSTGTVTQANALIIAGGGGGGGASRAGTGNAGGAGGGASGQKGFAPYDGLTAYGGGPGTQSGGTASTGGVTGTALQGGTPGTNSYGGGGGGGYWGGTGGGYAESNTMAGGGGGSGYFHPTLTSNGILVAGCATTPGCSGNVLRNGYGAAGLPASTGTQGVVIIRYFGTQKGFGGTVTYSGGYTYHTFTTAGVFTA